MKSQEQKIGKGQSLLAQLVCVVLVIIGLCTSQHWWTSLYGQAYGQQSERRGKNTRSPHRLFAKQLQSHPHPKVRISAVVSLTKMRKAVATRQILIAVKDVDPRVRSAACAGLAVFPYRKKNKRLKATVETQLAILEKNDSSRRVRKAAKDALSRLHRSRKFVPRKGKVYLRVGAMAAKSTKDKLLVATMKSVVEETSKENTKVVVDWPQDVSVRSIAAQGSVIYYIDGSIVSVTSSTLGGTGYVDCTISMYLASYPQKKMFGFMESSATVETGTSAAEMKEAADSCVTATATDVVQRKAIPVLIRKSNL